MKRYLRLCIFFLVCTALSMAARQPVPPQKSEWLLHLDRLPAGSYKQGEVIVRLRESVPAPLRKGVSGLPSLDMLLSRISATSFEPMFIGHTDPPSDPSMVDLSKYRVVRYAGPSDAAAVAKILMQSDDVEMAEPRLYRHASFTPNDPDFDSQYNLTQIKVSQAWDVTQGDSTVVVAIVDTGVKLDHPDLNANIWHNPGEMGTDANGNDKRFNGIDDDGDGYVDDWNGWDFEPTPGHPHGDNDPDPGAVHGTHVAGIAAAVTNNGIGIAGVAPHCRILPVKVSPDDPGANIIDFGDEGIVYAADRGAAIINCSFSGASFSVTEFDVIRYALQKGSLVIAAAGNTDPSGVDIDLQPEYPACYPGVMAVGSVDGSDRKSGFSNYGYTVAVSAPGELVLSTIPPDSYGYISGTSMSTPTVCGVAALVKSKFPSLSPLQLAQRVRVTADNIDASNSGFANQIGYGRLDAYAALTAGPSPAIRLTRFAASDSAEGNNNGVFEPDETIDIGGMLTNYLDPSGSVTLTLTSPSPYVSIINPTQQIRALGTLDSASFTGPFRVKIGQDAPQNQTILFVVRISSGSYNDYDHFILLVHPTYQNMDKNLITMTVTSKGTFGYNDYPSNLQGSGFTFKKTGADNYLFEGALMAATDSLHIIDAARGSNEALQDSSFSILSNFAVVKNSAIADEEGRGMFDDAGAGSDRIGMQINYATFAYSDSADNDYIILRYDMKNTSGAAVNNFCAGLFLDWDIGSVSQNIAAVDTSLRLGYAHDSASGGVPAYVGVTVLGTDPISFRAIDNADSGIPWGIYDGFTPSEKWQALSEGISIPIAGPADISMVIGVRHGALGASDSAVLPFAFVAGETPDELRTAVMHARAKWESIKNTSGSGGHAPSVFALAQNYPNPFNNATNIHYSIERESRVTLTVYDVLGREIETLVDFDQSPGEYNAVFPKTGSLASGIYYYRLIAGGSTFVRKMVYLK